MIEGVYGQGVATCRPSYHFATPQLLRTHNLSKPDAWPHICE